LPGKALASKFDEIATGFRIAAGGAQEYYGVIPDLAIFAHAIANGYPLAAVAGKKAIMRSQYDNFISSTYFSDTVSLAAGVAVLNELRTKPVIETINNNGKVLLDGIAASVEKYGIKASVVGRPDLFTLALDYGDQIDSVQIALHAGNDFKGYLLGWRMVHVFYAHTAGY